MFRRIAVTISLLAMYAPAAFAQQATLSGIITDSQKKPLPGARVIAVSDQPRYWTPDELEPLATSQTNQSGEFSIEVPTTGPVALIAWGPAHRMTKYAINPETAKSVKIGMALDPGILVKGQVLNRDTKAPLAGAIVGPLVAGLDTQTQRALRVVPQWATTDKDGAFSFPGVASDIDHQFIVQADGYVINNVELSAEQTNLKISMDKGGSSVGGEVYAKGARPAAFSDTIVRANGNGFDVVRRTDSRARFQFDGLPGGTFSIEPLLPESDRPVQVEVVEMPADHNTSISLEVSAGYTIRGTAIDAETSTPANQVSIGLDDHWTTSSTDGSFALGPLYQARQLTFNVPEEDGWKLDELIAINEYNATDGFNDVNNVIVRVRRQRMLEVQLDNFEATTQPVTISVISENDTAVRRQATSSTVEVPVFNAGSYTVYGVSGGLATGLQTVTVAEQKSIPVRLKLGPAANATGRVTLINSDQTTRVRGFTLAMHAAPGDMPGAQLFPGTNPRTDGGFTFPTMPTGEYVLSVQNETRTKITTHPITLTAGLNTLPDIQWEAGNRIAGRVVDPQGSPVPFAQVSLLPPSGITVRLEADEEGLFRAEDLESDTLTGIVAEAGGFATYTEQNVQLPTNDKTITLQPMGRLNIFVEAAPSTAWAVHVVRMSPWAVGTYAEQLMGQSIFMREITGGESLETGLGEEGRFRAVAIEKSTGALMVSDAFDWAGAEAKGKTVFLASTAKGSLSGSAGEPGSTVEVTVINTAVPESAGRDKAEFYVTATNGRYQLSGLPAGNYLILGAGEASSSYAINVELPAGKSVTADLAAVPMAAVTGVVEVAGEPVPGATVRLVSETDSSYEPKTVTTGADGLFAFEGLTPDSYAVSTELQAEEEQMKAATSVALKAGQQPAPVRLDLTPPQPVVFTVGPGVNLPNDTEVKMMNRQSRQLISARWTPEGLQADAVPGQYEVWAGDAVVGAAEVTEEGEGVISLSQ